MSTRTQPPLQIVTYFTNALSAALRIGNSVSGELAGVHKHKDRTCHPIGTRTQPPLQIVTFPTNALSAALRIGNGVRGQPGTMDMYGDTICIALMSVLVASELSRIAAISVPWCFTMKAKERFGKPYCTLLGSGR